MITVEQLWAVYLASLVVLGLIAIVLARVSMMRVGIGLFIAVLLASVITYLVAITNIDVTSLERGAKNSLQTLYGVIIIVIIIAFILMFYLEWSGRKKEAVARSSDKKSDDSYSMNSKAKQMLSKIYEGEEVEERAGEAELNNPTFIECDDSGCHLSGSVRSALDGTRFSYLV